ncbi:putative TetR family transcriptional regulator [Gordonia effusa NBRC 100432]|uniref:Putative TetR family transcriptional regulator n=1 Tax=Gordonia effusa NBRC 100432 TaxID=1077974 RepID=H0QWY4_9ACTN|nr:TetR/AcrR family transcriptional regulator [Gordonia effusa]GAB17335.1 putative TetR family transcriptional regulator [Gordonia effusa NBRC 100432]
MDTDHEAPAGTVRTGGRTHRVRTAVLGAALAELAEHGYAALTVEQIARRSGIHKTTIYRRWQTKEAVLAAAVRDLADRILPVQPTGQIDADLRRISRGLIDVLDSDSPPVAGAVRTLFSEAIGHPAIAQLRHEFFARRHEDAQLMVAAAIDHGQLPSDTDARELVGLVMAPIYYRFLVTGEQLNYEVADRAVEVALAAVRASSQR